MPLNSKSTLRVSDVPMSARGSCVDETRLHACLHVARKLTCESGAEELDKLMGELCQIPLLIRLVCRWQYHSVQQRGRHTSPILGPSLGGTTFAVADGDLRADLRLTLHHK